MTRKILLFLFFVNAISLHSQEWTQNNELTKVTFKIKNFGVNVDGNFSDVEIKTNFNSESLPQSYINAKIVVGSIATGIKKRDKHILEKDYFDEPNHKVIELKSTKIEKDKEGKYQLVGELRIKKTTKEIKIPLEILETEENITIKSIFTINRRDFKVGGGSFIMSKKVKIQVEYSGKR